MSVVITTYNRAQFLQRAIESALGAASDLEVIVVDDCSTDNTSEVCANRSDIRYVRLNANQGLANARNVGIVESASEFIAFLDDGECEIQARGRTKLAGPRADEPVAAGKPDGLWVDQRAHRWHEGRHGCLKMNRRSR